MPDMQKIATDMAAEGHQAEPMRGHLQRGAEPGIQPQDDGKSGRSGMAGAGMREPKWICRRRKWLPMEALSVAQAPATAGDDIAAHMIER